MSAEMIVPQPLQALSHDFPFDPTYGFSLDDLLRVSPPDAPEDFAAFWRARYQLAMEIRPQPRVSRGSSPHPGYEVYDLAYQSSRHFSIGGWMLVPKGHEIRRGIVVGHGYGGRGGPDYDLPVADTVFLFPCFRGLSRSRRPPISDDPVWHVLHDIDKRDRYILGGCVDDLWLAVSALLELFPQVTGHVGYMGISLGGGVGALALPWDERIRRAHLNVPTFGHQPLRLKLPTFGSGASVRRYESRHGQVLDTLKYYDAASAAQHVRIPMHIAAAPFDPMVAPPGQFAIHNALPGEKRLFVLRAGHFDHGSLWEEDRALKEDLRHFFDPL